MERPIHVRRKREGLTDVLEHADVRNGEHRLGKYRLVDRLDDIEVGEAYVANLVGIAGFEKRVVIWCLGNTPAGDGGLYKVAMHEAARGASLSHANLAHVLDVGMVEGVFFVATEHVFGPTLDDVLRLRHGVHRVFCFLPIGRCRWAKRNLPVGINTFSYRRLD